MAIDPTADFMLWNRPMDVLGGIKAIHRGKACQILWLESMQKNFVLVGVGFCPSIGPTGADNVDLETLSVHLSVISASCMYKGVGNCLVVKERGRCHIFLAHLEHLVELCWALRPVEFQM